MDLHDAYADWLHNIENTTIQDAFMAGWEAAMKESGPIFTGTLQGVAAYLAEQGRKAFMELRRETQRLVDLGQIPDRFQWILDLSNYWIGYGEAWGIVKKLVALEEQQPVE